MEQQQPRFVFNRYRMAAAAGFSLAITACVFYFGIGDLSGYSASSVQKFLASVPCNCTQEAAREDPKCAQEPSLEVAAAAAAAAAARKTVDQQWYAKDRAWHYQSKLPLCTMDSCFNFSQCQDKNKFLIYNYSIPSPPVRFFANAAASAKFFTDDPSKACVFMVFSDFDGPRAHPSSLPYWNHGLNHVIVTFADVWYQRNPPEATIGNASIMSSSTHETTYRPGFDIAIPLPPKLRFETLRSLGPLSRKYFATFRGMRYLGKVTDLGTFRGADEFRKMHNGRDVIVALTCRHPTNDHIRSKDPSTGNHCDEEQANFDAYSYRDLMNTTFGFAPAGRSPASYRFIEVISAGAIPVLIADNYVKPFDTLIDWHKCSLQFPVGEMARIVTALRSISARELSERQAYCAWAYDRFLKDDEALFQAAVSSLQARFYGVFPNLQRRKLAS